MPKKPLNKRQDHPIIKLMCFLLALFVLFFMGYHLIGFINDPVILVNPIMHTSEETLNIDGYFIRNETVLPRAPGVIQLHVDEGTRVGTGQLLASLYERIEDLEHTARIHALDARLEMLRNIRDNADTVADASALDQLIFEQLSVLAHAVDTGATYELYGESQDLRRLMFLREHTFEDAAVINVMITQVEDELRELQALQRAAESTITNTLPPAFFSAYVDGYEEILYPGMRQNITVAMLRDLSNLRREVDSERVLGKLVPEFHWYFAAIMPTEQAQRLERDVTIRFSQGLWATIEMWRDRVGSDEDGMSVVVFRSRENMAGTIRARRQSAEIIFRTHRGLRIPKNALHLNEYGETGVFELVAGIARWNPVEIIYSSESYYLLEFDRVDPRALRDSDELIIGAGLYDGKRVG
ncbi:MAG: hypothetical protein FWE06_03540 [Oscillospiraceae bacterium]|nr:hypothetical protein [Oscillospiraceae bacterium]